MVIYTEKEKLAQALQQRRKSELPAEKKPSIGFVPTMGALHQGHISLILTALAENTTVVVSIFVNPTQFNNNADLEKYPRSPEEDLSLLKTMEGDLLVFLPETSDIYGNEVVSHTFDFGNLAQEMEGRHRKGHFDGVGTVLTKFFDIIKPDRAYFGQKDFQQLQIVRELVAMQKLPIEIVGCPILREKNGLAMSSRNRRLNKGQTDQATILYRTLNEVKEKFNSHSLSEINKIVAERFLQNEEVELEYFEIADEETLKTVESITPDKKYRAFIAAFIGGVRLIDNMPLN